MAAFTLALAINGLCDRLISAGPLTRRLTKAPDARHPKEPYLLQAASLLGTILHALLVRNNTLHNTASRPVGKYCYESSCPFHNG